MNKDAYKIGTQQGTGGKLVGRDPRKMKIEELNNIGHVKKSLLKVIREKCLDCCSGSVSEIKDCSCITCPLWAFRMNKNPFRTNQFTEKKRSEIGRRLKESRQS